MIYLSNDALNQFEMFIMNHGSLLVVTLRHMIIHAHFSLRYARERWPSWIQLSHWRKPCFLRQCLSLIFDPLPNWQWVITGWSRIATALISLEVLQSN